MLLNETCSKCPLAVYNDFKIVYPRGDINSKLFIIGEAPGYKERKEGIAFVGKAGQYLESKLEEYRLDKFVYLTNIIKCRPPKNRTPSWKEIHTCSHKLEHEIEVGKPKIILLLGNTALNAFFDMEINGITKLNNKGIIIGDTIILFGVHPSYIIRQPTKEYMYNDLFQKVRDLYKLLINKYI